MTIKSQSLEIMKNIRKERKLTNGQLLISQ